MTPRLLVLAAAVLTVTGELEVLFASASSSDRLVSAVAVPATTAPLVWARAAPLPALAAIAVALVVQAALGGLLVGSSVTTIAVLALALFLAGRHALGPRDLAAVAGLGVGVAATRVAFDPAAGSLREALLTAAAVATPVLVGRWVRGQGLLQRELSETAARRARDRARHARHAAEEERARIVADLQTAVAGGLRAIAEDADALAAERGTREATITHERFARIARTARDALADVRRVLGVLRRDGDAPRLAPPEPGARATLPRRSAAAAAQVAKRQVRTRRTSPLNGRPAAVDGALAAAVLAIAAAELAFLVTGDVPAAAPLTALAVATPLLWRRRAPAFVAAGVLTGIGLQSVLLDLESFPLGNIVAMVIASYAVGAHGGRHASLAALVVVAAGAAAHAAAFYPDGVVPAVLGGVALPWTVGRLVSANRRLTLAERSRGAEIEMSRAREARAAVTGERMRVARELHDAVAHNISVIAIQAGGAEGIVHRDPERAADVAALIATVAREALVELGRLAAVPEDRAAPGLADIDGLASRARAVGLSVTLEIDADPPTLPAGIDLAAYRIVQEALANIAKHARAGQAWVTVRHAPRGIELEIADDGRGPNGRTSTRGGGGHGLVGMRERVALYGGSLDLGRHASGGFRVRARLPLEHS